MDVDMAYDSDGFEQVPYDDDADLGGWVVLADQQQSPAIVPTAQSLQEKLKLRGSPDQLRHRGILRERKDNYFEGKCPGQAMSRLAGHMEAAVVAGDRNVKKWLETEIARMVEVVVDQTQKNATASTRATETLAAADRWSSGQNYHVGSGPGELCNKHTRQKMAPPKTQWFSKYAQFINTVPGNTVLNNEDAAELKDKRPVQVPLGRNYFTSTCPGVALRNMPAGTTSRVPPPPRRRPPPPPASPPRPTCSKQAAPNNESERYRQAYDTFAPSTAKSLVALDRGLLKALLFHAVEAEISAMVDEDAAEPCPESGDGGAEAAPVPPAGPHENIRAAAQRTLEQLRVAEARASLSALRGRANSPAGSYLGRRRLDALSKRLGANRGRVGRQLERARYVRTRATARALFARGVGAAAGPDRRRDRDRELREAFGGGGGYYTRSRTPYARPRAWAAAKKKAKLTIAQKVAMAVDAEQLRAPSAESESERYRKAYNAFAYAPAKSRLPMPGRAVPLISPPPPPPIDGIPPPPPMSEFPRIPPPPPPPPVYRVPAPAQRPAAAAPVRPVKGDGAIDDVDAWVRAGYGVGDGAHQLLARRAAMSSQV